MSQFRTRRPRLHHLAAALIVSSPALLSAQIDFNAVSIAEPLTTAEIETALGAPSTLRIDGIAKTWGSEVFIVHVDAIGQRTFARINPETKDVTFSMSALEVATQLGAPYTPAFTQVGEFVYDPRHDRLIFADNSLALPPNFEYSLIAINVEDETATELLRGSEITGWNSHGVLISGVIVGALGEEREDLLGEEPAVGLVDPNDPEFIEIFDEDDFKDAIPGFDPNEELPPETIAVDPRNDDVYVFCHDELELFRISNIEGEEPELEWLQIPGWTGVVDLHAMDVDEDGNLYGWDEEAPAIVVWDGENTFSVDISDIPTALGRTEPFSPTDWRGMKARKISATQSEVLLASSSGDYGVVSLIFGTPPTTDFAEVEVSEPLTTNDIETALGAPSTLALDGVALGPGEDVFLVHLTATGQRTFFQINPFTAVTSFVKSAASLASDLGAPYTPTFTQVGEYTWDPVAEVLYLADNSLANPPGFPFGLIAIDTVTGDGREVLFGTEITGWNSHGILSNGFIVAALGEDREDLIDEEPSVGYVDPSATEPEYVEVFDMDDFIDTIVPAPAEVPPETIAIDPRNDDVYVFGHDELEVFRITDITGAEPGLERLVIDGWTGIVDLHAMAVDEDGVVWGYDEEDPRITWWDGEDVFFFNLSNIPTALGRTETFAPVDWRGLKVRKINPTQTEVWLASSSADYGLVRLLFGEAPPIDSDGDGFSDEYEREVGTNPFLASSTPTLGDVNDDGVLDEADLIAIANHIVGNPPTGTFIEDRADINGDGTINVEDVTHLANFLNGQVDVLR